MNQIYLLEMTGTLFLWLFFYTDVKVPMIKGITLNVKSQKMDHGCFLIYILKESQAWEQKWNNVS